MKAKGVFTVAKWDETSCAIDSDSAVSKISRASIIYRSTGNIQGDFNVEYVIHSMDPDKEDQHITEANYTGYMIFSGSIDGLAGTLALEDKGAYSAAGPVSALTILPYTGTGDLTGIIGTGRFFAEGSTMILEIDYSISA